MQNVFFGCCKNNRILKECISTIIKNCKDKNYGLNPWFPTMRSVSNTCYKQTADFIDAQPPKPLPVYRRIKLKAPEK